MSGGKGKKYHKHILISKLDEAQLEVVSEEEKNLENEIISIMLLI